MFPILNAYKTFSPDAPKPATPTGGAGGGCCGGSGKCGDAAAAGVDDEIDFSKVPPPMPLPEALKS